MEEHKKLVWAVGSMLGASLIMFGVVYAHDHREELAFVDHLCHFHLDEQVIRDEADRVQREKEAKDRNIQRFIDDLRVSPDRDSWGSSSRNDGYSGTCGPPDRDK